jgi:hypothetical protein
VHVCNGKLNLLLHVVTLVRCSGSAGVTVELSALHTQQLQDGDFDTTIATTTSSIAVPVKRTTPATTEVLITHCVYYYLYMHPQYKV